MSEDAQQPPEPKATPEPVEDLAPAEESQDGVAGGHGSEAGPDSPLLPAV